MRRIVLSRDKKRGCFPRGIPNRVRAILRRGCPTKETVPYQTELLSEGKKNEQEQNECEANRMQEWTRS